MYYGFENITHNSPVDAWIGESQLFLGLQDTGGGVDFKFFNTGPYPSSVTDVYFDDSGGMLLDLSGLLGSSGVSFSTPASPGNLPGGSSLSDPFVTTGEFSADSDPPVSLNGVDPDEWLLVSFDIRDGYAYSDILNSLNSGDLRVGIHVQAFCSGGSESFVNTTVVPVPGALVLGSLGLGTVGFLRRRRAL